MSDIKICAIKYGDSVLPDSLIFRDGDENSFSNIPFIIYFVKTGKKNILVDAGCKTMPGFNMKNFIGPVEALKREGISTDMITDVVITHAHHDHIECVNEFEKAIIHIQKDEYEYGKKYISENRNINIFDNEYCVTDDVKVLKIGGHTKGSCIVLVSYEDKCSVIVGDECYSHKCILRQIPTGSATCIEKSIEFIRKYSDCKYKLLFCHDEKIIGG